MTARTKTALKPKLYRALKPRQEALINDLLDSVQAKEDTKTYFAASVTADTVNDWRQWGDDSGFYTQICTVANTTKGGGTWVTKHTVSAS